MKPEGLQKEITGVQAMPSIYSRPGRVRKDPGRILRHSERIQSVSCKTYKNTPTQTFSSYSRRVLLNSANTPKISGRRILRLYAVED